MPKKGAVPYDPRGPPPVPEPRSLGFVGQSVPSARTAGRAGRRRFAARRPTASGTGGAFASATGSLSAGPGPMMGAGLETVSVAVATGATGSAELLSVAGPAPWPAIPGQAVLQLAMSREERAAERFPVSRTGSRTSVRRAGPICRLLSLRCRHRSVRRKFRSGESPRSDRRRCRRCEWKGPPPARQSVRRAAQATTSNSGSRPVSVSNGGAPPFSN